MDLVGLSGVAPGAFVIVEQVVPSIVFATTSVTDAYVLNFTWTDGLGAKDSVSMELYKVGRQVSAHFARCCSGNLAGALVAQNATVVLPTQLWPQSDARFPVLINDSNQLWYGTLVIYADGKISVFVSESTTFLLGTANSNKFYGAAVHWLVQ